MIKQFSFKGKVGSYAIDGKGECVVLVHGFAENKSLWEKFSSKLKKKYTVICPDLPGFGDSVLPENLLSIEYLADFVKGVLDNENINKCTIIGHSMGGYVALTFADKYDHRLNAIGLFHSHAFADDIERKKKRKKSIDFIKRNGTQAFVDELLPTLFAPGFVRKNRSIADDLTHEFYKCKAAALAGAYEAMKKRTDRTDILEETNLPVLFIIGKKDETFDFDKAFSMTTMPKIAKVCILEEAGHMGMIEAEEESLKAISEFLAFTYPKKAA